MSLASAPATLSQPVHDAVNKVALIRAELGDDTEAQADLLKAAQADVDAGKLDADSANALLAAYGAKTFTKAKDAAKPAEPAAQPEDPPKAETKPEREVRHQR